MSSKKSYEPTKTTLENVADSNSSVFGARTLPASVATVLLYFRLVSQNVHAFGLLLFFLLVLWYFNSFMHFTAQIIDALLIHYSNVNRRSGSHLTLQFSDKFVDLPFSAMRSLDG